MCVLYALAIRFWEWGDLDKEKDRIENSVDKEK